MSEAETDTSIFSESQETLPETQEIQEDSFPSNSYSNSDIWGRLYPLVPFLNTVDLRNNLETSFGRGLECDVQFLESDFELCQENFLCLSKTQFKIGRRMLCSGFDSAILHDFSSNGTFINGIKVGKNESKLLVHNDTISLCKPTFEVYTYISFQAAVDSNFPVEVSKKYSIAKKLGNGSQGQVHMCFDKETSEIRAIKEISKRDNERVLAEVNILSKLQHPHIIQMFGFYDSPSSIFIVMEFMACDLMYLIHRQKKLNEKEAKDIFYQVILGVEYLHKNCVIHRDLKPENILLSSTSKPLVKITDFGLSKLNTSMTDPDTLCGTPAYIAPEVYLVSRNGSYSYPADVWSLGVILFLCLSGTLPFPSGKDIPRSILICQGLYSFDNKTWVYYHVAQNLVKHMLVVNPLKRITLANIFKHPWISEDPSLKSRSNVEFSLEKL